MFYVRRRERAGCKPRHKKGAVAEAAERQGELQHVDHNDRTHNFSSSEILFWIRWHKYAACHVDHPPPVQSDRFYRGHVPAGRLSPTSSTALMGDGLVFASPSKRTIAPK